MLRGPVVMWLAIGSEIPSSNPGSDKHFFLHFHDLLFKNTPLMYKNGRFILKNYIHYYYAKILLFGFNIYVYVVCLPTVHCHKIPISGWIKPLSYKKTELFWSIADIFPIYLWQKFSHIGIVRLKKMGSVKSAK